MLVPFVTSLLAWILILTGSIHDNYADEEDSSASLAAYEEEDTKQSKYGN